MPHYFDENPKTASDRHEIACRFNGVNFSLLSDSDVFSKKQVDFGTSLLLNTAIVDLKARGVHEGRLLDLGCGYGVVGVVMQRAFHKMDVVLSDVNQRALALARENAKRNYVERVAVTASKGWEKLDGQFDVVLTNPPVRAGKETVFSFYEGACERLSVGGLLYVVLQKKQGAPSSKAYIETLFGNCEIVEKDAGYWIMRTEKRR